jgi:hypothetical protein
MTPPERVSTCLFKVISLYRIYINNHFQDYSDDEDEKGRKNNNREKNKRKPELSEEQVETKRLKEVKVNESTLYICGLPPDFRESNIKGKKFLLQLESYKSVLQINIYNVLVKNDF